MGFPGPSRNPAEHFRSRLAIKMVAVIAAIVEMGPQKKMWLCAQAVLKQFFQPEQQSVSNGDVVVLWAGSNGNGSSGMELRATHVSLMYWKPWRPTFLELLPFTTSDREQLESVFTRAESVGSEDIYVSMRLKMVEGASGLMQRWRRSTSS